MSVFYDQYASYGEETAWATGATPNKHTRVKPGARITPRIVRRPHVPLGQAVAERMFDEMESGEASLVIPAAYEGLEKILKHIFGNVATTGAGPYTHTFTIKSAWPPNGGAVSAQGMTIEGNHEFPDSSLEARRLVGGLVNRADFNFNVNEDVDIATEWIGERVTQIVKTGAPTYPDLDTYLITPHQITFTIDGTAYETIAQGVSLSIAQNRAAVARLGSRYTARPVRTAAKIDVSGSLRLWWEAGTPSTKAIFDKFKSGATASIVITATGPSSRTAVLTLSKVVYMEDSVEMQEGERLPTEWSFACLHDATNTAAKLVLTNQQATV